MRAASFPRNDSGVEIPGWFRQLFHKTPALIIVYASRFLLFRFRGRRSAPRNHGKVELWIHTTGSIGPNDQIRSEKSRRSAINSDTAFPSKSADVFQAKRLQQIRRSLLVDERSQAS